MSTAVEAQLRADRILAFRAELEQLERDGVLALGESERAALRAHHEGLLEELSQSFDIDRDSRAKQLSHGMRIASFLGALALAASVFFLFYQFWGYLPTTAQVLILLSFSLGTFLGTMALHARDRGGYFTNLAALLAWACFVLNVSMLGQIFNITPSDNALIPWAALAFLLAYACNLRLLLAAGILCVIAWVSARTGTWGGMYWLDFGERPENFFPAALAIFLVPTVRAHVRFPAFPSVYRVFGLITALLAVLVLSNWGASSYFDGSTDAIEGAYQVVGFVLSAAAIALGARMQWSGVVNTGTTFFVIFLYTKFYDWWWEILPKYLFFLIVGATAVALLWIMRRVRTRLA